MYPLRVCVFEDCPDRAVLSASVRGLEDDQEPLLPVCIEAFLECFEPSVERLHDRFRGRLVQPTVGMSVVGTQAGA